MYITYIYIYRFEMALCSIPRMLRQGVTRHDTSDDTVTQHAI